MDIHGQHRARLGEVEITLGPTSPTSVAHWRSGLIVCTLGPVRIDFDPRKNERNIRERQISFEAVSRFQFEQALVYIDNRHDYGEVRYVAIGPIDGRVHVLCFTETVTGIRVISLRKANDREVVRYAKRKEAD